MKWEESVTQTKTKIKVADLMIFRAINDKFLVAITSIYLVYG